MNTTTMTFRVSVLDRALFAPLFAMDDAALAARGMLAALRGRERS